MLPDRVSNPGPLTYESGALPIALRGPASRDSDPHQSDQGLHSVQTLIRLKGICTDCGFFKKGSCQLLTKVCARSTG